MSEGCLVLGTRYCFREGEGMVTAWMTIDCPQCQGEGYYLFTGGPGHYASALETYLPSEYAERCALCDGEGAVDVCAHCQQPPRVKRGHEVCGCEEISLPRAA